MLYSPQYSLGNNSNVILYQTQTYTSFDDQ